MSAATLHKPRSKLRLRLGNLTSSNSNLRATATATSALTVPSLVSSTSTTASASASTTTSVSEADSLFYSTTASSDTSKPHTEAESSPEPVNDYGRSATGSTASTAVSSAGTGIDDIFSVSQVLNYCGDYRLTHCHHSSRIRCSRIASHSYRRLASVSLHSSLVPAAGTVCVGFGLGSVFCLRSHALGASSVTPGIAPSGVTSVRWLARGSCEETRASRLRYFV